MDDQTRANNPDANLTWRNSDSDSDDLPSPDMPADVQSIDLDDLQPRPAPVAGHAGNANVDTPVWRMLSPILVPIPFAIVIFLFSLLAYARGINNITLLPLSIVLLTLVILQGICLYYAGSNQIAWTLSIGGGYLLFVLVGAYVFFGFGGSLILLVLLVVLALIFGRRFTRQVPVGYVDVVVTPRGRSHTLTPGFNLLYPWEKVLVRLPTKEIRWRTTPPVHVSISRDQEADIVADITYQLAEDVADIAVLHMANWEEDLHQYFLGDLKSIINDISPTDLVSWAQHINDQSKAVDDLKNPAVETRWNRLNNHMLWRLQSDMAQRGIQVNMVHVQDITILTRDSSTNAPIPPVNTGAVGDQQPQQPSMPWSPLPPMRSINVPPSGVAQAQATQLPGVAQPSSKTGLATALNPGVIQGMIASYQAIYYQFINDPNFIMDLAARFNAVADDPQANAQFPVDAQKAALALVEHANYILASEGRPHISSLAPMPVPVERRAIKQQDDTWRPLDYGWGLRFFRRGRDGRLHFQGQEPDEVARRVIRRSVWVLVGPALLVLASIAALITLLSTDTGLSNLRTIWNLMEATAVVSLIVFGIRFFSDVFQWWYDFYILTNKRIIHRPGLLHEAQQISIGKVQQVAFDAAGLWQLLLSYGDIHIYLTGGELVMKKVANPREVVDELQGISASFQASKPRMQGVPKPDLTRTTSTPSKRRRIPEKLKRVDNGKIVRQLKFLRDNSQTLVLNEMQALLDPAEVRATAEAQFTRIAGVLKIVRNCLAALLLIVTGLSFELAGLAYVQSIKANPGLVGVPFLQQWADGFPAISSISIDSLQIPLSVSGVRLTFDQFVVFDAILLGILFLLVIIIQVTGFRAHQEAMRLGSWLKEELFILGKESLASPLSSATENKQLQWSAQVQSTFDNLNRVLSEFANKVDQLGTLSHGQQEAYWEKREEPVREQMIRQQAALPERYADVSDVLSPDEETQLSLFALANVELEEDDRALVGKTYSIQAGISQNEVKDIASSRFEIAVQDPAEPVPFDIMVHPGEHVELVGSWYQRLLYNPKNPEPQFAAFRFQVREPGQSELFINFYRERQWLKTFHFEFDVVERSMSFEYTWGG